MKGVAEAVSAINVCNPTTGAAHDWRPIRWEQSISSWATSLREGKFPIGTTIKVTARCFCGAKVTYEQERPL